MSEYLTGVLVHKSCVANYSVKDNFDNCYKLQDVI